MSLETLTAMRDQVIGAKGGAGHKAGRPEGRGRTPPACRGGRPGGLPMPPIPSGQEVSRGRPPAPCGLRRYMRASADNSVRVPATASENRITCWHGRPRMPCLRMDSNRIPINTDLDVIFYRISIRIQMRIWTFLYTNTKRIVSIWIRIRILCRFET